ncbi:CDK5 regulatory subunit-associated protein 2 isoform X2 [Cynoglossus semilaevis]|uniref:CDK5 regulatory subunit-associated protein 2 isoform X2 n=1 Tax=Cynoglossus semilaevis TaxID=244447 RepID=UPI0007DCB3F2|nr:CDK5 regulatory subunit-associated protein 2 isoform X2 [Cynoglossus semilaevis]
MDSVVGDDVTLPVDINGSCRLADSINAGDYSTDSMTAPSFPEKMSPIKALTMKDYENQITALKKENFNLKLRIYFLEERMQQKCDDSTEDIFKTNIELKVELESMKREMAEKQELLVSASKALESLAGRDSGEPRVREQAQREIDAVRESFNKKIADLEQCLRTAEEEVEKMAIIAEQEKRKNIDMEKQLQALSTPSTLVPVSVPNQAHDLQQALREKDSIIQQLTITVKNQEDLIQQKKNADQQTVGPPADCVKQLSDLIATKDQELEALKNELQVVKEKVTPDTQGEVSRLEKINQYLHEELSQAKSTNQNLTKTLEDNQNQNSSLTEKLEVAENELNTEKRNALKRDKAIQGLSQVLKEKEKEITELCHEIDDRDDALAKAREAAHKAQLQKYQGAEEHQNLLIEKQSELAQLQGEHHAKVLEAQKLQRALDRKEQELVDLQQGKDQLEAELEDLQQQKKKGDKTVNDLNNQLRKVSDEIRERESALEQQYEELLDQTKRKLQAHEVTIQRLTSTLADKEQQLQEYINMLGDFEQNKSPGGNDNLLSKLRQRLKEKEKALEQALDEKFAAIEEKDNEIHQLQLSLREKERDLERLNNLLSHNEETVSAFDTLIKEKDVELQHLANTIKNMQRAKQDVEDNLNRSLREKDSIINQLQLHLEGKTKDMEDLAKSVLNQSQSHAHDLAEQMGHRLKVTEAMLAEAVKTRETLVADNQSAVEGLLATISSKDQLIKESAEHYNRMLFERTQEIQGLKKQLSDRQQELETAEKHSSMKAQEGCLETANLRALLAEKDSLINKLLQCGQEREEFLVEIRQKKESDRVLELRQTIQIMQEKLNESEAELSARNSEDLENVPKSKKTVVVLKKELAQKTEALNKALKRENELKMSLAELQSLLFELEGRSEGQAANIESLTSTLKTKDEIISTLHQRLGQRGETHPDICTQDQNISSEIERSFPGLPQRERTMIGGDCQQEAVPNLVALHQEHEALNKALRAEQQLYSSLVRTVKEKDSAQRLHALQLELTAVQLLRQQLEEGIKTNEDLREDLERETQRAKLREGTGVIDPKELESMRHQLEDAQRWNASLQARLGAIQNRGGGVGGANDVGDTLSFIGDQTSYMSICVGEGQDDSLYLLSPQELRQKVLDLQEIVTNLENQLSLLMKSELDTSTKGDKNKSSPKKQLEKAQRATSPVPHSDRKPRHGMDKESQTDIIFGQLVSGKQSDNESMDSGLGHSREHVLSANNTLDTVAREQKNRGMSQSRTLLFDCEATSVSHHREKILGLESGNAAPQGFLKEYKSEESKDIESPDGSRKHSDGQVEIPQNMLTLQTKMSDERGMEKPTEDMSSVVNPVRTLSSVRRMLSPQTKGLNQSKNGKQDAAKHGVGVKSRLPVPVRVRVEASSSTQPVNFEPLRTDEAQQLHLDEAWGSDQQLQKDSDLTNLLEQITPLDNASELQHNEVDSPLPNQVELLHQECQEKDSLIHKLNEQLSDLEKLHSHLQDKEQQYVEALQAAESTIAYLTACSLDNQVASHISAGAGPASIGSGAVLHSNCVDVQKAEQDKEQLNNQLIELLSEVEKTITFPDNQENNPEVSYLCLKIRDILNQANSLLITESTADVENMDCGLDDLQQRVEYLQEALKKQNMINAELKERLRVKDATEQQGHNNDSVGCEVNNLEQMAEEQESDNHHDSTGSSCNSNINQDMTKVLMNCFSATASAIASLTEHCTNSKTSAPVKSSFVKTDLQKSLDHLQEALQEKEILKKSTFSIPDPGFNYFSALYETKADHCRDPHQNICILFEVFTDLSHRIAELQTNLRVERGCREESETRRTVQDGKGLPPDVQLQLETLHKALREKKKACKNLEEKLATALTSPETASRAPEYDDKCVQVDFQDLGYETSGKSENDREESSSTDLEVGVNPSCSASSLPLLLKHEQATYSSTENLDSNSSTPYPSSPAFSSAKVSLKSLQIYDEYGISKDPLQLQAQVRELKVQLENQTKLILQMQSLLRRNSHCSDLVANSTEPSIIIGYPEGTQKKDRSQNKVNSPERHREKQEGDSQVMKDKTGLLNMQLEGERSLNRSTSEQLSHTRSSSTSPAKLDSLVQSQARELSQLRQQIKESRALGALQRRQLEELSKTFKELLQAHNVDFYMGKMVKEQLEKSLCLVDRLEGRLDKEDSHLDNEDVTALELSRRLTKELLEKNNLIQSLQSQSRTKSPRSHHSSHSDLLHSDRTFSSGQSPRSGTRPQSQRHSSDWMGTPVPLVGGAEVEGVSFHRGATSSLQGLHRENERLQEQLKSSEELNATLRSELDLHQTFMAHNQKQDEGQVKEESGTQTEAPKEDGNNSLKKAAEQSHIMNPDLLAEHLQEIRALRQRLEESIRTNDRLREQLEKRLAEVENDSAATNIFIRGNEEPGHLANEVQFLLGQSQGLKEQLNIVSRDKQKEVEKLRDTLARRSAKLDQSRRETEELRLENSRLLERLEHISQENSNLQASLNYSKEELQRLQSEVKVQRQQLSDSQHLLQSLRVELQVHEKMWKKTDPQKHESSEMTQESVPVSSSGSVDLSELLSEIRQLRLQLERSIQTNTALRQKLEEQLLRGANRSETININYLLSSPDEGGRSLGREGVLHDDKRHTRSDVDGSSISGSSSSDSTSGAPSRLVPGHRMWANRNGRHILGLIEDYSALRKQISEGRKLSRHMDTQLQECLHTLRQQSAENKVIEQQHLKSLSSSMNTMQQVLDEAGRLLKLVWRVSLPTVSTTGDSGDNQQDELLKIEISRLKSRLSQQERMLSGAVKRLRTTNQLKEGMERVIIDQLSLTHGVLKKARGNLETNYCSLFGLKGPSAGPDQGAAGQWPVEGAGPVYRQTSDCHSESSEDHHSDTYLHCSL